MTQTERIVAFLRAHPGCTSMELTLGLSPFVANPRARISDARAQGVDIECVKEGGLNRYYLRDAPVQTVLFR